MAWLVERLRRRPWLYRLAVHGYDQWLLWRRRSEIIPALVRCLCTHPGSLVRSLRHFTRLRGWRGIRHALRYHTAVDGSWSPTAYRRWLRTSRRALAREHDRLRIDSVSWPTHPRISLLLPVRTLDVEALRRTLQSVLPLLGPNVELCIAAPAALQTQIEAELPRMTLSVRFVVADSTSPARLLNAALSASTCEYIARIDICDELEPAAPLLVADVLRGGDCDIIYTDEDQLDSRGRPSLPFFKAGWDPEQILAHDCAARLLVLRRSLIESVGGWRDDFDAIADYDLALRCADATTPERIQHVPRVLYHRRTPNVGVNAVPRLLAGKVDVDAARVEVIRHHLTRRGLLGHVEWDAAVGATRVRWAQPAAWPLVSVIIPTRDRIELLRKCVEGLLTRTEYPRLEILIVDHDSREPATQAQLAEWSAAGSVRVLPYSGPFNHSAMNNLAVAEARGNVLCLLNNDIEPIDSDWLREMVTHALREEIGAVGAKLIYPDDTLQHAGVVIGWGGVAGHIDAGFPRDAIAPGARTHVARSISAVTAACLVIRKAVFDEIGGFDAETFPVAFNDVDLCLRLGQAGYRNVWTPHAELYHHESASLGSPRQLARQQELQQAVAAFHERWGRAPPDPFYNEQLSLWHADARAMSNAAVCR
jgi:GT2 family glycosyltransferase